MDKITFSEYEGKQFVTIDRGNEEFTFMSKETYDAMQVANTLPSNSSIPQAGE